VFGVPEGGLEPIAHAWSRKIALKSRRIRPIRNWSARGAREGKMATGLFACAVAIGGLLLLEGARFARRRKRLSINAMLDSSRPCATRRR